MKKSFVILICLSLLVLSLSFISAFSFSDIWRRVTGQSVSYPVCNANTDPGEVNGKYCRGVQERDSYISWKWITVEDLYTWCDSWYEVCDLIWVPEVPQKGLSWVWGACNNPKGSNWDKFNTYHISGTDATKCGSNGMCSDGECVECNKYTSCDATITENNVTKWCRDMNADGTYEWVIGQGCMDDCDGKCQYNPSGSRAVCDGREFVCSDKTWKESRHECSFAGETRCSDSTHYQICKYNHLLSNLLLPNLLRWSDPISCKSGEVCDEGACVEEKTCTDSDGGKNYYEKGKIYINGEYHNEDKCTSPYDGSLNEWYCGGNLQQVERYNCPNGCEDGACVMVIKPTYINIGSTTSKGYNNDVEFCGWYKGGPYHGRAICTGYWWIDPCNWNSTCSTGWEYDEEDYYYDSSCEGACVEEKTCTDSDGGLNYYEKGYASGILFGNKTSGEERKDNVSDECVIIEVWSGMGVGAKSEERLLEWFCSGSSLFNPTQLTLHSSYFKCPNGCENGACVKGECSEEICDRFDNDCDGEIDEDFDKDGDGYYNEKACSNAYTLSELDCDDNSTDVYCGHPEICDNKDNDCDWEVDTVDGQPLIYLGKMCFEGKWLDISKEISWHNKDGENWMTPVRNQGGCGSCWAFSTIGTLEGAYNVQTNNPNFDLDLSEQELVSCSSAGSCSGGWSSESMNYIKMGGILTESCFPYTAQDSFCSPLCSTKYSINSYRSITGREVMKAALQNGPLNVCLYWGGAVQFSGGIGRCEGRTGVGHCVTLVGYNDEGEYWIIKNSWGPWWEDGGYGRIGYGECGIENFWGQTIAAEI